MRAPGPLFRFDEADDRLTLLPIAARRALDRAGLKLSLEGWQSLPLTAKRQLVDAGASDEVNVAQVTSGVLGARPAAAEMAMVADPDVSTVPAALVEALGVARSLTLETWQKLSPLQRYAIAKTGRHGSSSRLDAAYDEIVAAGVLTHLNSRGEVHMVGIASKEITDRMAEARAVISLQRATLLLMTGERASKGDVLAVARVAGIQAAKRTSELIPLCHLIALTKVEVVVTPVEEPPSVHIVARAQALDRTGVEMEALVAASTAALTVYDMLKSVDRGMTIERVELTHKAGGRTGEWRRPHLETSRFAVTSEPLSVDSVLAQVTSPEAGGVALFLGYVRNHNQGKTVVQLEYEAYATMALAEMQRIATNIEGELPGVRLGAHHRVGSLGVGELAVVCAASAVHRAEAFAACRLLIDRVKEQVPIWKREHGPEGPYWVGWEDARCAHGSPDRRET